MELNWSILFFSPKISKFARAFNTGSEAPPSPSHSVTSTLSHLSFTNTQTESLHREISLSLSLSLALSHSYQSWLLFHFPSSPSSSSLPPPPPSFTSPVTFSSSISLSLRFLFHFSPFLYPLFPFLCRFSILHRRQLRPTLRQSPSTFSHRQPPPLNFHLQNPSLQRRSTHHQIPSQLRTWNRNRYSQRRHSCSSLQS